MTAVTMEGTKHKVAEVGFESEEDIPPRPTRSPSTTATTTTTASTPSISKSRRKIVAVTRKIKYKYKYQGKLGAYTHAERMAKIQVFLEKRKRRNWRKKVKYGCRKKLADSRPRVNGRFVPRALQEKFQKEGCSGPGVTPPKETYTPRPHPMSSPRLKSASKKSKSQSRSKSRSKNPKSLSKSQSKIKSPLDSSSQSESEENKPENRSWKKLAMPKDRRGGSGCAAAKSAVLIPFTNYYLEMHPLGYYNEDMMPLKKNRPRTNSLSFLNAISSYTRHTEGIDTTHVSSTQASYA